MNGIMKWLHVFSVLVLFDQIYNQPHYYVPNSDYENIDNTDGITPSPSAKLDEDHFSAVVREFGQTMNKQVEDFTAFRFLENEYLKVMNEQNFHEKNGNSLVNEIAVDISKFLKKKIKAVKKLAGVAQEAYKRSNFDEMIDFDYLNNKKLLSDDDLKLMGMSVENATKTYKYIHLVEDENFNKERINTTLSTVHVPTNVFDKAAEIQNGVKWSEALDKQFTKNKRKDDSSKWQYFCSSDGFFRIYPGMKWPKNNTDGRIDTFDCRMRSWYTKAATSPKNVIVLVDSSGSMKGLRMKITHSTVDKILQTLSDEDHFNVIQFSAEPAYVDQNCTNRTLIHASESNKRRLLDAVKEIEPKLKANFSKALIEAFELFREVEARDSEESWSETGELCNKAIMLITDGAPESYEKVFKEYNWPYNKSVRVFTYLIGKEASDSRNARWMANANRGYYTHISTMADVQENVQQYIRVMSKPLALSEAKNHIWTSVYADYITETSDNKDEGLKYITSFASPVYDLKGNVSDHKLLGVVGTDVTVKQIQELIPYNRLGPNSYAFVVTHQGYVLFHPNYKPMYLEEGEHGKESKFEFHPDYRNIDITEVELAEDEDKLMELRKHLLEGKFRKPFTMKVKVPFDGEDDCTETGKKRVMVRPYTFYFSKITDTDFYLGIAVTQEAGATIAYSGHNTIDIEENENIRIAPWRYCKEEWKTFADLRQIFKKKFNGKNNETKAQGCSMYSDSYLQWDLSVFTNKIFEEWDKRATEKVTASSYDSTVKPKEVYRRFGIEQVFLWTFAGVTKFITASPYLTEPNFIDDNVETVTNKYYRQTVQGVELGYNYTYFVPPELENRKTNDTVVTITRPVYIKNFTTLVTGIQIKYSHFLEYLYKAIEKSMKFNAKPLDNSAQEPLTCHNSSIIHCYIIDSNGLILYSNEDVAMVGDIRGKYLPDFSLMANLIKKGFVKSENYVTKQDMCKKQESVGHNSSAAFLLNPFRKLMSYIFWLLTESVMFLFEYSWFSQENKNVDAMSGQYTGTDNKCFQFDLYSDVDEYHQKFLLSHFLLCKDSGIKPCATSHTRYMANFNKLKDYTRKPYTDKTSDCSYCKEQELSLCRSQCERDYSVQWIENTNLMFLSIAARYRCGCFFSAQPPNLDIEQHYDEKTECEMILNKTARIRILGTCKDSHPLEPQTESGVAKKSSSIPLLLVTCLLCVLANQKSIL